MYGVDPVLASMRRGDPARSSAVVDDERRTPVGQARNDDLRRQCQRERNVHRAGQQLGRLGEVVELGLALLLGPCHTVFGCEQRQSLGRELEEAFVVVSRRPGQMHCQRAEPAVVDHEILEIGLFGDVGAAADERLGRPVQREVTAEAVDAVDDALKQLAGLLLERHRATEQRTEQQRAQALLCDPNGRGRLLRRVVGGAGGRRGEVGRRDPGRQPEPHRLAATLMLGAP